jgi:sugar lactone lactonase YvrE
VELNPAGGPIDSNPYGVLAEPGVRYVTDAGANALLAVWSSGHIETVAVFPKVSWNPIPGLPPFPNPADPVPTTVARGPDGALYVGLLTGVPFAPGAASVYRVVPGEAPTEFVGGFKAITDLAFDDDGNLYVLEHSTGGPFFSPNTGKLTRVAPPPALTKAEVRSGLNRPTSVAVGPDGAIFVTNNGVFPGIGEVLKITP